MHGPTSGSGRDRGSRRRMSSFNGGSKLRKQSYEPLTTMEEVPERLKEQAEALFETGEEIKVAVSTDLRFDGTYGKDWLLVTNRRLIAFNQNGALGHHMREVPLTRLLKISKSLRCTGITFSRSVLQTTLLRCPVTQSG